MVLVIVEEKSLDKEVVLNQILPFINKEIIVINLGELFYSIDIEMSINNQSDFFILRLKNGKVINSSEIQICINLCPQILPEYFNKFVKEDRGYVSQEWHSIFLSMMYLLKDKMLMNEPKPYSLKGEPLGIEEFLIKASCSGLQVRPYFASHTGDFGFSSKEASTVEITLFIYENQLFCDDRIVTLIPHEVKNKLYQFTQNHRYKYLEIQMEVSQFGLYFKSANPIFSFTNIPQNLITHLIKKINNQDGTIMRPSN